MEKKVQIFLEKYHMIEENSHIAVGFSGGADSVCLLLVLQELSKKMKFSITAVHVEHGIRGEESRRDAAFAGDFCVRHEIPFLCYEVDAIARAKETHQTLEEAARELRYDCFEKACKETGASRVAVAHHGDDCAETMLFHLSRGTGIRGLCGIVPVRDHIIRPLLCVTRAEIEEYVRSKGETYCMDSTNQDTAYTRNHIRQNILPLFQQINPCTVQHMTRTAGYLEEVCEYLENSAWDIGKSGVICAYDGDHIKEIRIQEKSFKEMHPVLQKNLLHQLIGKAAESRKDITARHIASVRKLFDAQVGRECSLPYGLKAKRDYQEVVLFHADGQEKHDTDHPIAERQLVIPGETVWNVGVNVRAEILPKEEKFEKIPQKTYTKWFDYDKIKDTVLLRNRRTGDYIQVNREGGHKKLKDFFIDAKIPKEKRDDILLLADGSHIIWAVGYRISEAYKVTQKTKRILCVCVDGGKENE